MMEAERQIGVDLKMEEASPRGTSLAAALTLA
jgi:hypothetical protein